MKKELTGYVLERISTGNYTQENGLRIKKMVKVFSFIRMEVVMMGK